jgi:hypothetical protein
MHKDRRMRRLGGLFAALVVTAIALLAVTTPSASAASTRAEYIAQADPLCAAWIQVSNKQLKGFPKDAEAEQWRRAVRRLQITLRAFNRLLASLSGLQPPAADAAQVNQWLAGLRAQTPLAKALIAATKQHSFGKVVKSSGRLAEASQDTQDLVAGFGFQSCDTA